MKKINFLKSVLSVAVAMLIGSSAFGQVADGNYVEAGLGNYNDVDTVTVGTTTGLYAEPDPTYHPNYNTAGSWALTAGFAWTWTINGGAENASYIHTAPPANYVEITWGSTAGTYAIQVAEVAPAAYGGCTGATVSMNAEVIAAPTVTLTADASGTILGPDIATGLTFCEGDTRLEDDVQATFTSGVIGSPSYSLQYTYVVDTLNMGLGTFGNVSTTNYTVAGSGSIDDINADTYILTKPTDPYSCVAGASDGLDKVTRYTYTLVSANDRISRKGDYLGITYAAATDYTWYAASGSTSIAIVVNPAPTTGPIFHISNMYYY